MCTLLDIYSRRVGVVVGVLVDLTFWNVWVRDTFIVLSADGKYFAAFCVVIPEQDL